LHIVRCGVSNNSGHGSDDETWLYFWKTAVDKFQLFLRNPCCVIPCEPWAAITQHHISTWYFMYINTLTFHFTL
jgi:hypothetical protein